MSMAKSTWHRSINKPPYIVMYDSPVKKTEEANERGKRRKKSLHQDKTSEKSYPVESEIPLKVVGVLDGRPTEGQ